MPLLSARSRLSSALADSCVTTSCDAAVSRPPAPPPLVCRCLCLSLHCRLSSASTYALRFHSNRSGLLLSKATPPLVTSLPLVPLPPLVTLLHPIHFSLCPSHALLLPLVGHCHPLANDNHAGNQGGGSPTLTAAMAAASEGGGGPTAAPASTPNAVSAAKTLPRLRQHCLTDDDHAGNQGRQPKASGGGGRLAVVVDGSG